MQVVLPRTAVYDGALQNPLELPNLQLWLDSADASNLTIDSSGRVSRAGDKSGNSGTTCIACNGGASNSVTTPTKSVTGNQTFTYDAEPSTWNPAGDVTIFSKLSGNDGCELLLLTTGVVRLRIGDGAVVTNYDSTAGMSAAANTRRVVVVTYVDGGTGTMDVTVDGVALGAQVATTKTLTNAAATATFGMANTIGKVFRTLIGSVYNMDPSAATKMAGSFSSGGDTYTVNTSGATGARISGARDLYQGTAANQPVYLPWAGANYGYVNGVAGNCFTTPDVGSFYGITGSFDIDVYAAIDNWGANQILVGKDVAGSRTFELSTSGAAGSSALVLETYDSAGASKIFTSSAQTLFSSRTWHYIRAKLTWTLVGNILCDFYTSDDGVTWTPLGTQQSLAATGNALGVYANALYVGQREYVTAEGPTTGKIGRVRIYDDDRDTTGTLVADFDPSRYPSTGGSTLTGSTGETWTINGGATIVDRTFLYLDGSNDSLKSAPFSHAQPVTRFEVLRQVTWTSTDYLGDGNATNSGALIQTTSTPQLNINAGSSVAANTGLAVKTLGILTTVLNGASSSLAVNNGTAATGDAGSTAPNGATVGARGANDANYGNMVLCERIEYAGALSASAQARVRKYLAKKWRIAA